MGTAPAGHGVAEAVRQRLGECRPAERKVARVLLAAYPSAGFETVARLADRAGVSAPTVIRFVNRLGYRGFPEFQQALRDELEARNASPLTLYDATGFAERAAAGRAGTGAGELLHRAAESFGTAVRDTFTGIPPDDLDRAVRLLADPARRVLVAGGRFSQLAAHYLHLHLAQLRTGSQLLSSLPVERAAALAAAGRKDVLVVFDYRRYEPPTLELARFARARGAKVVLVTDTWLSPVADVADAVLPTSVAAPSPYDSLVPAFAVAETLVAGVLAALGEAAHEHMLACEQAAGETALY